MQLLVVGAAGYVGYRVLKSVVDKAGEGADRALDALAKSIAGKSGMAIAEGITYTLPTGARISARSAQSAGGPYIMYLGQRYKVIAADPPGSGNYKVTKA